MVSDNALVDYVLLVAVSVVSSIGVDRVWRNINTIKRLMLLK